MIDDKEMEELRKEFQRLEQWWQKQKEVDERAKKEGKANGTRN